MKTERRKGLSRHLWPERTPCRRCGKQMTPSHRQPADKNSSPVTSASQFPLWLSDDSFQSFLPNCCLSLLGTRMPRSAKLERRNLLRFILWISITWDKKVGLIYILSYRELSELVDYYCTELLCQLGFVGWLASTSHLVLCIDYFFLFQDSFPSDWWKRMQFKQEYGIWHIPDLSEA